MTPCSIMASNTEIRSLAGISLLVVVRNDAFDSVRANCFEMCGYSVGETGQLVEIRSPQGCVAEYRFYERWVILAMIVPGGNDRGTMIIGTLRRLSPGQHKRCETE